MSKRHLVWVRVITVMAIIVLGVPSVYASGSELVSKLVSSLGVTPEQATGGAGALFNMAKSKLSAEDFTKIASAVPSMDSLLSAAPEVGGLAKGLGGVGGGLAGLAGSFKTLGLSPDMAGKFAKEALSFVQSSGGDSVMKLLEGAIK
jgi:Protein of unknown function VcgC/VcgE (DUF2780)